MTRLLRKDYIWAPVLAALFISGLLAVVFPAFQAGAESTLTKNCRTSSATTSPAYLTTTGSVFGESATTTCITGVTDISDFNIHLVSSSSATTLRWKFEFSHNGVDWYGEDLSQVSSATAISHSSTTPYHTWTPGDADNLTRLKNVHVDPISSEQVRVIFSVTGANGAVHVQAVQKSDFNR